MFDIVVAGSAAVIAVITAIVTYTTGTRQDRSYRWPLMIITAVLLINAARLGTAAYFVAQDEPIPIRPNVIFGAILVSGTLLGVLGIRRIRLSGSSAESARRATLRQMRRTISRAPAPIGLVDERGVYVFVNDAGCAFFRYPREAIIGRSFRDFIADNDGEQGAFARLQRDGVASAQRRILRGDGTTVIVLTDMIAIGDGLQLFVAQDITPQMEAQATARIVEGRLQRAQDVARVGSWEADIDGGHGWWSDGLYHLLGLRPGDVPPAAAPFLERVHPEDRATVRATVERTIRTGTRSRSRFQISLPDGRMRTMRQVAEVIDEADGQPRRITGAIIDITEEARLRDQANRAERFEAITRATAGVVHDFSNLLSVLQNNIALAREMEGAESERRMQKADQAADRARELVARLLDFSRSDATALRPGDGGPVDLAMVVTEAVALSRDQFPPDTTVVIDDLYPAVVIGDADDLHRLCMNLLVNAAEVLQLAAATDPQHRPGQLVVSIRTEPRHPRHHPTVILRFADNGPGMSEDVREHAFDPFFTTKRTQGGSGLGLATTYAIARAHGGMAMIESYSPAGTTVAVRLPLATVSAPDAASTT